MAQLSEMKVQLKVFSLLAFFLSHFLLCEAFSSIQAKAGIHFYKSPQSLFPSSQKHRRDLEKSELREEWLYSFLVQHSPKKFWVKSINVIHDLDLARSIMQTRSKDHFEVMSRNSTWLQIKSKADQKISWISQHELRPDPEDLRLTINVISTSLRQSPKWESNLRIILPPLSILRLIKLQGS